MAINTMKKADRADRAGRVARVAPGIERSDGGNRCHGDGEKQCLQGQRKGDHRVEDLADGAREADKPQGVKP